MAANSVQEFLPSLPDEPHPLNYFQASIWKTKLGPAVMHNGQESRYSCQCEHLSSDCCFVLKMVSEAISEHLNSKHFLGEHARRLLQFKFAQYTHTSNPNLMTSVLLTTHQTECLLSTLQCTWSGRHSLHQ